MHSIEDGLALINSFTNEHCLVLYADDLELGVKYYSQSGTVWMVRHQGMNL